MNIENISLKKIIQKKASIHDALYKKKYIENISSDSKNQFKNIFLMVKM